MALKKKFNFDMVLLFLIFVTKFEIQGAISEPDLLDRQGVPGDASRYRRQVHLRNDACIPKIQDNETYYSKAIIHEALGDYWIDIQGEETTLHHLNASYELIPFSFPFFGQTVSHMYPSTLGFLSMHELRKESENIPLTHQIAPFFSHHIKTPAAAFYIERDDKAVFEWKDVFLHGHNDTRAGHFQIIIQRNGTIVFLYRQLPKHNANDGVMVGLYSALLFELKGLGGISVVIGFQPASVDPAEIKEGTVVIFNPLSSCNLSMDAQLCETPHISFYCKHCHVITHCAWETDSHVLDWMRQYCTNKKRLGCETIDTTSASDKHDTSLSFVIVIAVVVVVLIILSVLGGWIYYAYRHPISASGRWLIEHRPSQWKSLCWKRFESSRKDDQSPYVEEEDSSAKDGGP